MDDKLKESVDQERELGIKPVKTLFLKYSAITLVGMFAQLVMVILEGVIIGHGLGANGFGTIALFMPLETLNLALGGFFGLGVSTLVGIKLGKKDEEGASKIFAQGFWFSMISVVIFSALIFFNAESVARFLGGKEGYFLTELILMIKVFMVFYPFSIVGQMLSYVGRVDEKPALVSTIITISAVVAISWLYLSLNVLGLGLFGVAVYYGLSIGLFFLLVFYFIFGKTILKISFSDFKIEWSNIRDIAKIGFPTFLISASLFVFSIVLNNSLTTFANPIDVAAYGIINGYIIYIVNMVCQSLQAGLAPVAAYNYGNGATLRLKELLSFSMISSVVIVEIISLIILIFSTQISQLFSGNDLELIHATASITKYIIIFYGFGNLSGNLSTYYQSLEKVGIATFFGISRFIIFALPLVLILPNMGIGAMGIWYAFPIADLLTGILCAYFVLKELKSLKNPKFARNEV